jgi:hypothetical protein
MIETASAVGFWYPAGTPAGFSENQFSTPAAPVLGPPPNREFSADG